MMLAVPAAAAQDQSGSQPVDQVVTETVTEQRCLDVAFDGRALISPNIATRPAVTAAVPAGGVTITNATSSDSYVGRENVTQTSERWDVQFLDAGGAVIATSAPTADLPDLVQTGTWSGPLGPVNLPSDAVSIRPHHRPDLAPDGTPNSVFPGSVRLCWSVEVEVVVTLPPTTAAPETTIPATTAAPATTSPATTAAPATTSPATTAAPETTSPATTAATQVLDLTESPTTQAPAPAAVKSTNSSQGTAELARTGFATDLIAVLGASLFSFGAALAYLGRRNELAGY